MAATCLSEEHRRLLQRVAFFTVPKPLNINSQKHEGRSSKDSVIAYTVSVPRPSYAGTSSPMRPLSRHSNIRDFCNPLRPLSRHSNIRDFGSSMRPLSRHAMLVKLVVGSSFARIITATCLSEEHRKLLQRVAPCTVPKL